jgi:hypothetical protein
VKRLFSAFGLAFFLSAVLASGQTDEVFSRPLNSRNRSRFDAVCAAMAEHPLIKGAFTQTKTLRRLERSLVSTGSFIIDAGRGMIWDTKVPFASVMAVGRDYLIQISGGKKTKLDTAGNETFIRISEIMRSVFTGNTRALTENFELFFSESGENRTAGQGFWKLGLIPKDRTIRNFAASIIIQGDSALRSVILNEQNGDSVKYELSNHYYPETLNSSEKDLFSF